MNKGWRIILGIVLAALILGAVCIGVGFLTGAELPRITQNLEEHYHLSTWMETYAQYFTGLLQQLKNLF